MPVSSGTRLGRYEILAPLGAGGMGEVYRARDSRLGRDVAIKVLPAVRADRARLSRFEKEARSASALNHPAIVTIHDVGESDGVSYIAMELVSGQTLRELMAEGALPTKAALQIAAQVADGLARAHEAGIVHRDLKPENIMVTRDGFVKVLDFGIAKLTEPESAVSTEAPTASETAPGVLLGTTGYMSPEQAADRPVDFRSDQFALGSILYEMATGKRAFARATAPETLSAIIRDEPEPIASLAPLTPAPLRWIIERCLAKSAADRYAATRDLAKDLTSLKDRLLEASGASTATRATPSRRQRARPWMLATGALACLALLAAAFLAGHRTAAPSLPSFQRLTFRRGAVMSARYTRGGDTAVYAALWEGDSMPRVFSTRVESPESMRLDLPEASLFGVSTSGELALAFHASAHPLDAEWRGTLARAPLSGGTPRAVLDGVSGADWTVDGDGFAVVRRVGRRSRLEYPVGKTLFESDRIWSPRVSPDGQRIAFFSGPRAIFGNRTGMLSVVDRSGKVTALSGEWKVATTLAWVPGGHEVWFTATNRGVSTQELYAVSLSGRQRMLLRMPVFMTIQDIAADGRALLTSGSFRLSTRCLPPGAARERDMSLFESSRVEELSEDGTMLLFSEHGAAAGPRGALYVTKTAETVAPIRLGEASLGAALSPDGRWAAVRGPHEIVLLPTGAGQPRRFSTRGVYPLGIRWFRDGKRCMVTGVEPGRRVRTYGLDVDSGELRPLTPEGLVSVWQSPEGKELLCRDDERKWIVYSLERREGHPAPGLGPGDTVAAWATDGFVYLAAPPKYDGIYRLDLRTGKRTLWRSTVVADPVGPTVQHLVAPTAGAYCYTTWSSLSDLYEVRGLK